MSDPVRPDGPVRCPEHGDRPECTRQTKSGTGRCHGLAIAGLAVCRMHAGVSGEAAKAKGQAALARQRFRDVDPADYLHPLDVLAWALTVAQIDVADYRADLLAKIATGDVPSESELDRASRLVAAAATVAKQAHDAGVSERQIRLSEQVAEQLVTVLRGVVADLGHDPTDPAVQAVVRFRLELVRGAA